MSIPLIGVSQSIEKVRDLIQHVADTGLNIVISGESGVGKEVVAQSLHGLSRRRGKPFIKINCASIPEGLLESELFGYERGAFTGASRRKLGKFELAHSGVLFLDEIGEMPLTLQSKLLHVLQSGEFSPLGSEKEVATDTWVMAATNQDLEKCMETGRFRKDLYFRLNTINIAIPPLRSRLEDIAPLVSYYMEKYSTEYGFKDLIKPDAQIMDRLMRHNWPGNVRELQTVLKRYLVLGDWEEIFGELTRSASAAGKVEFPSKGTSGEFISNWLHLDEYDTLTTEAVFLKKIKKKASDQVEKEVIGFVLHHTKWNRSKASKILKVSYKTLLNKISKFNFEPPDMYERAFFS